MRFLVGTVSVSLLWATAALAQPAPDDGAPPAQPDGPPSTQPPATQPPVAPPAAEPPPASAHPGVDQGVIDDANSGRSWLSPTALTAPAGTWSFSDYELLSVGASYAVTDHFSLSATTLIPVSSDQPFVGLLTAKYQFLAAGNVRLAAQAAFGFTTGDGASGGGGTVGGVATICFDHGCNSHFSGYAGFGFGTSGESTVPVFISGSLALRVARHVKLVGEADTGYLAGNSFDSTNAGFLLWYGVRFTSRNIGVDLGLMEPIFNEFDANGDGSTTSHYQVGFGDGIFPIGFPFISFTYRGLD